MSRAILQAEADRLLQKSAVYGPDIRWQQTEFSEILPFPTPLSLSVLRALAGHEGATGMVCREFGIPYNHDVPIDDYLETIFGRTFVNSAAEQLLTKGTTPPSFWRNLVAATRMQQEKRSYYLKFNHIIDRLDTFYQEHRAIDLAAIPDPALPGRIEFLLSHLNDQYRSVVKAGLLAKHALDELASGCAPEQLTSLLTVDYRSLRSKPEALPIFAFREQSLDRFAGYGAEIDYELSCPRFLERQQIIAPVVRPVKMESPASVPIKRKTENLLLTFKIYESLKIIFKTMLLRELYLLRLMLLEYERRNCRPGEVFYLTLTELLSDRGEMFSARIAERQATEAAFKPLDIPGTVALADLAELGRRKRIKAAPRPLSGISVHGRPFAGQALICTDGTNYADVDPTRILVVRQARPDLVVMFGKARGIVAETGGMLSHLAIVARERGFPLVIQVTGATAHIKDGDRIEVDKSGNITINNRVPT